MSTFGELYNQTLAFLERSAQEAHGEKSRYAPLIQSLSNNAASLKLPEGIGKVYTEPASVSSLRQAVQVLSTFGQFASNIGEANRRRNGGGNEELNFAQQMEDYIRHFRRQMEERTAGQGELARQHQPLRPPGQDLPIHPSTPLQRTGITDALLGAHFFDNEHQPNRAGARTQVARSINEPPAQDPILAGLRDNPHQNRDGEPDTSRTKVARPINHQEPATQGPSPSFGPIPPGPQGQKGKSRPQLSIRPEARGTFSISARNATNSSRSPS